MTIDRLLQACTVRLHLPDTGERGTGFWVAPGWILTCHHVVREATALVQVTGSQGEDWGNATLAYPAPQSDLALLTCATPPAPPLPAVALDPSFQPLDRLYSYGYPSEFPQGASVTAECEGSAEDEGLALIKFKAGQFQPGISGSPVLNLRSGQVCGVVKFTRDRSSDLGGGAIPIALALEAFPFLAALQQAFHQADRRWATAWSEWQQTQSPTPSPSPPAMADTAPPRSGQTLKAQTLQKRINALEEEHQAVVDALVGTIDPTARIRLERQITQLEAEISRLTDQLNSLGAVGSSPPPPGSPLVPHFPLESPEGAVPLGSPFYIPRSPQEEQAYRDLARPHALLRIKSPHAMGKSSLLMRVMAKARDQGNRTATIDLGRCDRQFFESSRAFLLWLSAMVGRELKVKAKPTDDWDDLFGPNMNCSDFFEAHLLREPLVLALDNFDRIFAHYSIDVELCGLLRAWHEEGKYNPVWANLRLVLAYSMESYTPKDINQSPFNVGTPVFVEEFTAAEAQALGQRHGLETAAVAALMEQVQGHPLLLRQDVYGLAQGGLDLATLLRLAPTEAGTFGGHLRRLLGRLEQQPELRSSVVELVRSEPQRFDTATSLRLEGLGLVRRLGNGLVLRNPLYRAYFGDRL